MHRLAVSTVIAFAWLTVASSQLPCTSQLRLILPHLFAHCSCSFSEWSEWEPIKVELVRVSQCPSGEAITEERRQRVVAGNCVERREERVVCKQSSYSACSYFCCAFTIIAVLVGCLIPYSGKLSRFGTKVQNENFVEKNMADCSGPIIM